MVLHISLSRETHVSDNYPVMFVLATVYRPQTLLKNLLIFYLS